MFGNIYLYIYYFTRENRLSAKTKKKITYNKTIFSQFFQSIKSLCNKIGRGEYGYLGQDVIIECKFW